MLPRPRQLGGQTSGVLVRRGVRRTTLAVSAFTLIAFTAGLARAETGVPFAAAGGAPSAIGFSTPPAGSTMSPSLPAKPSVIITEPAIAASQYHHPSMTPGQGMGQPTPVLAPVQRPVSSLAARQADIATQAIQQNLGSRLTEVRQNTPTMGVPNNGQAAVSTPRPQPRVMKVTPSGAQPLAGAVSTAGGEDYPRRVRVVKVSQRTETSTASSDSAPVRVAQGLTSAPVDGDTITSTASSGATPSPAPIDPRSVKGVTVYEDEEKWPWDVGDTLRNPTPQALAKVTDLIEDVTDPEVFLEIDPRRSRLIRTRIPVSQFSITHPDVLDVVQYSPTEFELIGGDEGQTTLTLWFGDSVLRYLVRVMRDKEEEEKVAVEYGILQRKINEMFPNSMVQLIPFADKLIVRGQAIDAREAAHILDILGAETIDQRGRDLGPGSFINLGSAAQPYAGAEDLPTQSLISLLEVPGEQQIMLKVRIAEMTRSAIREIGSDLVVADGNFGLNAPFDIGDATNVFQAVLSTREVFYAFQAIATNSYAKILAEPNLVTLNGQPASFIAGGEFAVPTFVGVGNQTGLSTTFRGFGTQLSFTPTLIEKDLIRLVVSPSFSQLNQDNSVGDIPGLDSRAVTTTVNLREGQWLAIAGLIQDKQEGSKVKAPLLGDIPLLDVVFSKKNINRGETELVVLVSPELIRPMEPEQVPLILPGMDVTEPNDWDFYLFGYTEGRPCFDHRSTVWPQQQLRIREARNQAMHQCKQQIHFQRSEKYYVYGKIGFSE